MFDSVAFDVVIGLVLIYLLYSLFITIVGEMLSTWMAIRSRMLRIAIERMLNDGYYDDQGNIKHTGFKATIAKFFLKEYTDDFRKSFAGKFYNQPAVKYLSKGNTKEGHGLMPQTKPSYFTDNYFVDALLRLLKDKGTGNTDHAKVKFCLDFNTHNIQPNTLKHLRNLLEDSKDDIAVFREKLKAWYNEMMDRINGWYKRKMQFILFWLGFIVALAFNVDSIKIAKILAKDENARNQLVQMGVALAKDSTRYSNFTNSDGDTILNKVILDSGYARVSKDIAEADLVLGLGWNFSKRKVEDTYEIERKCDSLKYDSVQKLYSKRKEDIKKVTGAKALLEKTANNIRSQKALLSDALFTKYFSDSISFVTKEIKKYQAAYDSLASLYHSDTSPQDIAKLESEIANTIAAINKYTGNKFSEITAVEPNEANQLVIKGRRPCTFWEIVGMICGGIPGFIITALMLSLGAPFWFDLLKKLVALRGAGVKPEEKQIQQKNATEDVTAKRNEEKGKGGISSEKVLSNIEVAIQKLKSSHEDKRIVSIQAGFIKRKGKKEEAIEIHVTDEITKQQLTKEIGNYYENFPVNYIITSHAETHNGECGDTIHNETKANGFGTLGCFLKKTESDKSYLLSCWHVLKGNFHYEDNSGSAIIKDNTGSHIASVVGGCLSGKIDVGFAEVQNIPNVSNNKIAVKSQPRLVTRKDAIDETGVQFIGARSGVQGNAVVFNDSLSKSLDYPDNSKKTLDDLFSITVYKNDEPTSPSNKGDSGSVVVDKDGFPLGILVGGDAAFSYVAKFSNILLPGCLFEEYSIII